jgi:uncharacterized protein (DUF1697 family)
MAAGKHVALLRGINVGRAKRVAMADLRALVEGLGYSDVRTLLNSGNVVFTSTRAASGDAASRIEKALAKRLGIASRVTVLTAAEVDAVITENPLLQVARDPTRLLITVLSNPADRRRVETLTGQSWTPEVLAVGKRVAYLWCPEGLLESRLPQALDKLLGEAITTRNWSTMTKLHALMRDPE